MNVCITIGAIILSIIFCDLFIKEFNGKQPLFVNEKKLIQNDSDKEFHDMKFDEIANYLAGYESTISHQEAMNKLWNNYEEKNLKYLKEWQLKEIANLNLNNNCKVFYPFSGPDVLHMITLFPNCKKYIMIGLEPHGKIENLVKEKIDLDFLRQGIHSLLNRSFFVTSEMWSDFGIEKNGLILPMLTFLKRMNYKIMNVEPFYLNDQGIVISKIKIGNGIKITFCQSPYDDLQEIFYIRKSLVGNNHGIDKFIKNDKPLITYLKAAQYTLFDERFSNIREALIAESNLVLQDDSGLPYRYFNNKNWQVSFYGNYEGPYGKEFKAYMQEDLKKSYDKSQFKPLPFNLGYGYRKISTILIKAVKNNQ